MNHSRRGGVPEPSSFVAIKGAEGTEILGTSQIESNNNHTCGSVSDSASIAGWDSTSNASTESITVTTVADLPRAIRYFEPRSATARKIDTKPHNDNPSLDNATRIEQGTTAGNNASPNQDAKTTVSKKSNPDPPTRLYSTVLKEPAPPSPIVKRRSVAVNKTSPVIIDKTKLPKNSISVPKKRLYSAVVKEGPLPISPKAFIIEDDKRELQPNVTWVDTTELLEDFMVAMNKVPKTIYDLFSDGEGCKGYNRFGELCTLQFRIDSKDHTWIVDILVLQYDAFYTAAIGGLSLKQILESPEVPKAFFDVRMDSDILYGKFGVHMHKVIDLQLMEYATKNSYEYRIRSLFNSIQDMFAAGECTEEEWQGFKVAKSKGTAACKAPDGYEILLKRKPQLDFELKAYAYQDVELMPKFYRWKLSQIQADTDKELLSKIIAESTKRVDMCLTQLEDRADPRCGPEYLRRGVPPSFDDDDWYF